MVIIKISVVDTGIGLTPETISKLFRRFSRAKDIGKVQKGGSGLGLYIAREMVNAHGGRIWVESEGEGKGSQFYIELPPKPPKEEPDNNNDEGDDTQKEKGKEKITSENKTKG